MDPEFWLERWQKNEIGFHASDVQPALATHWPALGLAKRARVLVPLCGKSLDMVWLEQQGFHVAGAELSQIAVRDFFAARALEAAVRSEADFEVWSAANCEIWCGDFFALKPDALNVTAAYDRAALVAMPPDMQPRYAQKMAELLPAGGKVLLVGLDYDQGEMPGPPFAIPQGRVHDLFGQQFDVTMLDVRDGMVKSEHLKARGLTRLEEASYLLVRK